MKPQLVEEYVAPGSVLFEYRDYAFRGPEATLAAEAAFCGEEQGQFWRFHDTLFLNQDREGFTEPRVRAMAEEIGLDAAAFDACLASERPTQRVAADLAEAEELGVNSTPSFFVNGTQIEWQGWDGLKQTIDAALAEQGS